MKKGLIKNIFKCGSLVCYLGCAITILVESGINGQNSANQSDSVANNVQDIVNQNHDNETIKDIKDFNIDFLDSKINNTYNVGDILNYKVSFVPSDTSYKELKWESTNDNVVHIDEINNCLSFTSSGNVEIKISSVKNDNLTKYFSFIVKEIPVEKIEIKNIPTSAINIGETIELTTNVLPSNATSKNLVYESSNTDVATINDGVIVAKNGGETNIKIASLSNQNASTSFSLKVNKKKEAVYSVKGITLTKNKTTLTSRNPSILMKGTYYDIASNFDITKLKILDENNTGIIDIYEKKYVSAGNFSFKIKLKDKNIAEIKDLKDYKINIKAIYNNDENLSYKENIIVSKLLKLSINDVGNIDKNKRTFYYINYLAYEKSSSINKDNLIISVPYKVNTSLYDLNNYKWIIYEENTNNVYDINSYFKKIESYNSIKLVPVSSSLPASGTVRYIPNINDENEYIDIPFEYQEKVDINSRITDFKFDDLNYGENKYTDFLIGEHEEYENILKTTIEVSKETPASVKSSLTQSKLNIKLIDDNNVATFVDDELNNHVGIKFNKVGTIKLNLSSSLAIDLPVKTYYLRSFDLPNTATLLKDNIEIKDPNVTINKNEITTFSVKSSFITTFASKKVEIPLDSTLSWSHDHANNDELIIIDDSLSIQGLKKGENNEYFKFSFNLYFNSKDITNVLNLKEINLKVNYVPIQKSSFDFSFELIKEANKYNSPNDDFSIIPLGTTFKLNSKMNEDATNKKVVYSVSNDEILNFNSDSELVAIKKGKVKITMTSLDDDSIIKSKTIKVVDTVSPFTLNFDVFKPLKYEEIKKEDGSFDYYSVSLDYGISYQIEISKLCESSSSALSITHLGELPKNKHYAIDMDKAGRITTKSVGEDIIKLTYGNQDSSTTYSTIIHFNVIRNTKYSFSELAYIVRKLFGHFGLFAVTALFGTIFISLTFKKELHMIYASLISLLLGFSLAGFSELIQLYTPGRYGARKDVGIDTGGYALTVVISLIVLSIIILIKYINKKRQNKKSDSLTENS